LLFGAVLAVLFKGLVRVLANELRGRDITVNAVAPAKTWSRVTKA